MTEAATGSGAAERASSETLPAERLATELVTYDGLPASAGSAHSLRTKSPAKAAAATQRFLDACTQVLAPPVITFQLWSGGPEDVTDRLASFAADRLGGPSRKERTHTEWRVRTDAVDDLLDAVGEAGPSAVTRHGHSLASLGWSADVLLTDPKTSAPYVGIDAGSFGRFAADGYGRLLGASGVRASIGTAASSLSLWLGFPADERLGDAAAHVQDTLPFRLSTKHWRRWTLGRDGRSYRAAKIPSPLSA